MSQKLSICSYIFLVKIGYIKKLEVSGIAWSLVGYGWLVEGDGDDLHVEKQLIVGISFI